MDSFLTDRVRQFHRDYPICDMLGLNLTHPRFLLDDIDLGKRDATTRRARGGGGGGGGEGGARR